MSAPLLTRWYHSLRNHLRQVSWTVMFAALLAHMTITWLLLSAAGETKLLGWDTYPYYYVTTASTIGYGDLSPGSVFGRFAVALFVIPGAVALFAAVLAKTSAALIPFWKRHQVGKMSYDDMHDHTVLIGWRGAESARLVRLLREDGADANGIVLVAEGVAENPLPESLRFVAITSYADCDGYTRAAVNSAARIIVHAPTDDQALAAVFAVMAHAPSAHVVAHFDSEAVATLVHHHHPRIECTRPLHVDVIVRAATDAGSSLVASEWLSASGPTQFSLRVPADAPPLLAGKLATAFRAQSALWIGYRSDAASAPVLNPDDAAQIGGGALLYYLANARIDAARIAWPTLGVA